MTYEETLKAKAREACPYGGDSHEPVELPCVVCDDIYAALLSTAAPLLGLLAKKDEALKIAWESLEHQPAYSHAHRKIDAAVSLQPTAEQGAFDRDEEIARRDRTIARAQENLAAEKERADGLEREANEWRPGYDQVKRDREHWKSRAEAAEERCDKLQSQLDGITVTMREGPAARIKQLEERARQLKSERDSLIKSTGEHITVRAEYQSKVASLTEKLAAKEKL